MAAAPKKSTEFVEGADVTESPDGWEWDTVAEAAPTLVVFDTPGESFIGQYRGKRHVDREPNANGEDQSFDLFLFKGRDGELYSVNTSYALNEAMEDVDEEQWVRITYVKDVKVANWPTPMKSFKVDVRR